MGLDPELEDKGKEDEEILVDTNWNVQDVVQLVSLDILSPDEARKKLGLSDALDEEPEAKQVKAMYQKRPYEPAGKAD